MNSGTEEGGLFLKNLEGDQGENRSYLEILLRVLPSHVDSLNVVESV